MANSHAISKNAWRLYVALRSAFFALLVGGVSLLALGRDYGIFVLMLAILCGYAAVFRRCGSCGKHFGLAGNFWLAFANPFAVRAFIAATQFANRMTPNNSFNRKPLRGSG